MVEYERYAELRDARGLTDYAVANGSGVSQPTLSAWKKGEYTPKIDKISRIAVYLGVPLEELLKGVEDAEITY